jgi:uncharacterized HAD superfamily protein
MISIGIDIDGVLYPWHESVYRYFCEFKNFTGTQYQFWKYFGELSPDTQKYFVELPFLYSDTTPHQDVLESLPLISELCNIYYITSRPVELRHQTLKFFSKHNFPFSENIYFTSDKETVIRLHNIEFFLDDMPFNIEKVSHLTKSFLFKSQHNRDRQGEFKCVGTLKEFHSIIKQSLLMKELGYDYSSI